MHKVHLKFCLAVRRQVKNPVAAFVSQHIVIQARMDIHASSNYLRGDSVFRIVII